jgi:hypothetical protein
MEDRTWEDILSICDQVEELLATGAPMPDPQRLRRVQFLCARMCGPSAYVTEKANKIASRAERYFSVRKHEAEPGGAPGLMRQMRYVWLSSIRDEARIRMR